MLIFTCKPATIKRLSRINTYLVSGSSKDNFSDAVIHHGLLEVRRCRGITAIGKYDCTVRSTLVISLLHEALGPGHPAAQAAQQQQGDHEPSFWPLHMLLSRSSAS